MIAIGIDLSAAGAHIWFLGKEDRMMNKTTMKNCNAFIASVGLSTLLFACSPNSDEQETMTIHVDNSVATQIDNCERTQCRSLNIDQFSNNTDNIVQESDLERIVQMNHVKVLTINDSTAEDISLISRMTWLEELHIPRSHFEDLSFLKSMQNLRVLHMHEMDEIEDISFLSSLSNLKELSISARKVSEIPTIPRLEILDLFDTEDIEGVGRFAGLREIKMRRSMIEDFSPLLTLPQLEKAEIDRFESDLPDDFAPIREALEERDVRMLFSLDVIPPC